MPLFSWMLDRLCGMSCFLAVVYVFQDLAVFPLLSPLFSCEFSPHATQAVGDSAEVF